MTSSYIKTCLICWLRFKKQIFIFATEAGKYNSDVIFIQKSILHEIEIKTSIQDFKADFKKRKHLEYKNQENVWAPAYFWFAVPQEILPFVQNKLKNTSYGILLITKNIEKGKHLDWKDRVKIVKKPIPIHKKNTNKTVLATILRRLASDLCSRYISTWK